ncbi:MAG: sigma-54-dependent Fis family transcriptional regulator [Kiritimatiellae bacterium]|nr:sigma-54-dependent Fis family transcriptional regulator [Kiritimatiellia bacterium]
MMREVNLQALRVSAQADEGPRPRWIRGADIRPMPDMEARNTPCAYIVRNGELPVIRTHGGDRVVDCGVKHKATPLSKLMLGRQETPLLHGSYSSAGQLLRSVRTLVAHALERGEANLYFIGVDDELFDGLWRQAAGAETALKPEPAGERNGVEGGHSTASPLLMELLPREVEPDDLARTFVGNSLGARLVRQLILRARRVTEPILIVGEPGTGKDLVAHTISRFREGPFIQMNCAAAGSSADLELFGPRPTERRGPRASGGLWKAAAYGTLYLDEISALPMSSQVKVGEAIKAEFERKPDSRGVAHVRVRVIAATNRELGSAVTAGQFDERLFYLLRRFTIHTPALREHPQDIPLLAGHLWRHITGRENETLASDILARLQKQSWPGNVRELKAALCRLRNLFGSTKLTGKHMDAVLLSERGVMPSTSQDRLIAHHVECLQHLRKADEVIQAARVATEPLQGRRRPTSEMILTTQEQVLRRLAELDILCMTPLLFGGYTTYAIIHELRGRLHYFCKLLASDARAALRFWRNDLSILAERAAGVLFDEWRRLQNL